MPARLVTIPISHFCEKARWALDRAGVAYVEEPHLQLVHIVAARRAGGGQTVPVLVTAGGEVIADSPGILRWADTQVAAERALYPAGQSGEAAAALEAWLDGGLGPDGRLWMYHETLPVVRGLEPWALAGVPRWERQFFHLAGRFVDRAIRRYLRVDAAAASAALERVRGVFDDVARRLSEGRPFLLGDHFTAADLTFAALAAPVLLPERYGSPLPPPEAMPEAMAREVRRLRAHAAGEYADRLYADERASPPTTQNTMVRQRGAAEAARVVLPHDGARR
jgi:glutathione S-transferase